MCQPCASFNCQITLLCMNKPHFNYSFTSWWALVLWLLFGYYKDARNLGTVYKVLCEPVFSIFLGVFLGVALLGHMVTLCLTFWGTSGLFFKMGIPFYILTCDEWGFPFPYILSNACYCLFFFVLSVVGDVNWYHTEALVCLSWLMIVNTFCVLIDH